MGDGLRSSPQPPQDAAACLPSARAHPHHRCLVTPATRALVVTDPNNPTGASYSTATRRAILDIADHHGLAIVADEVYGDHGHNGPVAPIGSLDPDAPIITFSSLSKAYLAPG